MPIRRWMACKTEFRQQIFSEGHHYGPIGKQRELPNASREPSPNVRVGSLRTSQNNLPFRYASCSADAIA